MRKEYEMTEEQFNKIIKACEPVPMIMLQCGSGPSQQSMANSAWESFGKELGFEYMTVEQSSKGNRFFTAEVTI